MKTELNKLQKTIEDLRIKVYSGQSLELNEKALYELELDVFKLMDLANGDDSGAKALYKHSVMPSLHLFKERRNKLRLTLRQVAEQTNVSAATISRIEREEGLCSYHNVVQLDDYYCRNGA